ncbi:MAG TPA: hypothetical protein VHN39_04270 [Phenylobacterium sp.]|nr:hypothetical protein [Phenylobacterium sp.]
MIRLQRLEEMESLNHGAGFQFLDQIRELGVRADWNRARRGIAEQNETWRFCGPGELDFTELPR